MHFVYLRCIISIGTNEPKYEKQNNQLRKWLHGFKMTSKMVEWWLEERHRARSFGVAFNYSYVSNYVSATVKVYPAKEVSTYVCMYTLAYVRGIRVCGALRRYWLVYMHVKVEYFHLLHTLKLWQQSESRLGFLINSIFSKYCANSKVGVIFY